MVTIDQNRFSEQALVGILQYISDDKTWLLLQNDDYSISRYHISTDTHHTVINAYDPDRYEYSFTQDSNDDFILAISVKKPDSESYETPLLTLKVSLPDTP